MGSCLPSGDRCVRSSFRWFVVRLCSASGDSLSLSSLRRDEQTREQKRKEHNTGSQETRSPGACVGTSSCVRSAPRPVPGAEREGGRQAGNGLSPSPAGSPLSQMRQRRLVLRAQTPARVALLRL